MMSRPGQQLAAKIQERVGRNLTSTEQRMCEEMVMNFYTNALLRFADRFVRPPATIEAFYFSVMNGHLHGANRRFELVRLTGRLGEVFDRIVAYAGEGISQTALEDIVEIAYASTDAEIIQAIDRARAACICSVGYVKAIIFRRRQKTMKLPHTEERRAEPVHKKAASDPVVQQAKTTWKKKLDEAQAEHELTRAEQAAQKSIT